MSSPARSWSAIASAVASSWASARYGSGTRHSSRARTRGGSESRRRSRSISHAGWGKLPMTVVGRTGSIAGGAEPSARRALSTHPGSLADAFPFAARRDLRRGDLDGGAAIGQVAAGGPAERAGLRSGDVVTGLGGKTVKNSSDLVAAIAGRKPG